MDTEKVIKSLEKLAEKLGTTAKKITDIYVKNAKMYRIYFIIELLLSLIGVVLGVILLLNFVPEDNIWPVINTIWVVIGGAFSVSGLIGLILTIASIREFINSWVNPEYEAMEDLFGSLFQ